MTKQAVKRRQNYGFKREGEKKKVGVIITQRNPYSLNWLFL